MQNIFIKPIKLTFLGALGILGGLASIGLNVLEFLKTYPFYSITVFILYYFSLVYKEWSNQKDQKKQREEHENETARLKEEHNRALIQKQKEMEKIRKEEIGKIKQQYITKSEFNPRDTVQIMKLVESKFEKNKWYPQEALWDAIYEITFTPYSSHFKKEIMVGLAKKDLIKIIDKYGRYDFLRK